MDLLLTFNFKVVCSLCSVKENEITYTLRAVEHQCSGVLLLAKAKDTTIWRPVSHRPTFPNPSRYEVCWFFTESSGCTKHRNRCTFARSHEEAAVWTFIKHQKIELSKLITLLVESERIAIQEQNKAEKILTEFSGEFLELCKDCFCGIPSTITGKRWNNTCAADAAHVWSPVLVHHLAESHAKKVYNQIRPAPPVIPFGYCNHVMRGMPCWHGPTQCRSAHSEVEMAIWLAEVSGSWNRQEVLQLSQERQRLKQQSAGDAVTTPKQQVAIYCKACLVTLSSHESFFKHCDTLEHAEMISGDITTVWKHRSPPHGRKAELWLCDRPDSCEYGSNCVKAHSEKELEEWLMRAQVDREIMHIAKAQGLISYRDQLLEEYRHSSNEVHIMSEQVDDVTVTFDEDLCVECLETNAEFKWNFQIKTERVLAHVALLKQEPGASFSLDEHSSEPCSYSTGEQFWNSDMTYDITLSFKSTSPGLYKQWLVMDFDMRPVLLQKLQVKVGLQPSCNLDESSEKSGRPSQNPDRWHRGNRVIIPCLHKTEAQEELLNKYKPPQISFHYKPLDDINTPMNQQNYRERMHSFLYTEEQAEDQVVSRLNVQGTITLSATLNDTNFGRKTAPKGELFCSVSVQCMLTPDTPEGLMLRRGIQSALIAPVSSDNQHNKVYEAIILRDATSKHQMHLQLSRRCCSDLKLQTNEKCEMEVQFQLNRVKFCEMHKAVDLLPNTENVLPDLRNCSVPVYQNNSNHQNSKLNEQQQAAIHFIIGDSNWPKSVAPFLIYGPFGTGKTCTLATAARQLALQPHTKVLICTHTNSSADLYVSDHFHPYVNSGQHQMMPLRMKANKQGVPMSATDKITQKYCLPSEDGQFFLHVTRSALDRHKVIITTTAMAKHLHDLKLPDGYFTHILIDEASRMLECEALMPLGLAGPVTRVVLAGDHMQMGPKLFSVDDDQRSNHTLLNRLFHFYQGEGSSAALKSRIIFNQNYRSTKEIVEFVSTNFYVGKSDAIKAVGDVPAHPNHQALRFHHVRGEPQLDNVSMSWYNLEEATCVVDIVRNLLRNWPETWGIQDQSTICVLSEGHQVLIIRKEFRKIFLGRVIVENIANVQGKQFRAIVMTAVHNRDNIHSSDSRMEFFNDARVLNTAMTRAQSQVVVVGDAAALCYFGRCSRIWRNYIDHCITKGSAEPKQLTNHFIEVEIKEISKFQRSENIFEPEFNRDSILQELQEEQNMKCYSTSDEDSLESEKVDEWKRLYNSSKDKREALLQLSREQPNVYKRGELIMENHNAGYVIPFGNPTKRITINSRCKLGKSFDGDEVMVEILDNDKGQLQGKVLGTVKEAESQRVFACTLEEEDIHKFNKFKIHRKIMVPLNNKNTKICILPSKKDYNIIPIWEHNDGKWNIIDYENLNEVKQNHIFMVEVFSWKENPETNKIYVFPLGNVIDIVPIGSTFPEALSILDKEFKVEQSPTIHVLADQHNWTCTEYVERKDLRELITFTVDPEDSEVLDDAISVFERGGNYEIGIHISDVASLVKIGDFLDDYAKTFGVTLKRPKTEKHMFPNSVTHSHLSLQHGQDRMVISLIVIVNKETHKITNKSFQFSLINCNRKLSYKEAEEIISERSGEEARFDELEDCVAVAYCFAKEQRKTRLGKAWAYKPLDAKQKTGERRSHLMIEELSVLFNYSVSEYLLKAKETMNCTPLRCQKQPDRFVIEDLKKQNENIIPLSSLRHNLDMDHDHEVSASKSFSVLTSVWNDIVSNAKKSKVDIDRMIDLIATDDIYPQLLPVMLKFRDCLDKAYVSTSNSSPEANVGHYSLHLKSYTQASSPIRRYMDVIVQRLLHSVISGTPVEYSAEEIDILGQKCEARYKKANEYEKKAESLSFAMDIKKQNALTLAFVVDVAVGESFKLSFPFDMHSIPDSLPVLYRNMQLEDQPLHDSTENYTTLKWKRRLYSVVNARIHQELKKVKHSNACTELSQMTWQNIINAIDEENYNEARSLILEATTKQTELSLKHATLDLDEACDDPGTGTAQRPQENIKSLHYVDVTLQLKPGDTLQVQMTSEIKKGYWTPTVQLVCIKPIFEVCVNHTHSPITCFSKYAKYPSKCKYKDPDEYTDIWTPLCEMESTANAVDENDSIIIEELELKIKKKDLERKTEKEDIYEGTFSLPLDYIKEWAIECDLSRCLLCIRKRGLETSEDAKDSKNYIWVAHGVTTKVVEPKKNSQKPVRKVHFDIHHLPIKNIPRCVDQEKTTYTVEIIPKLVPDLRKEMAVKNIGSANKLVQNIALGQPLPKGASQVIVPRYRITREEVPEGLPELNESQYEAVDKALNSNFTLIQGPPGTGKTVVGVYIVYWFLVLNSENTRTFEDPKDKDKKEVILYCGPSNKSVDVVAEYLLKVGDKLKPLRVYSQQMEMLEYPYPGSDLQLCARTLRQERSNPKLRGITLHHLIRQQQNPHSREINVFDKRIKDKEDLTDKEVEEYKKLLSRARVHELQKHDVILCTCTAASTPNLTKTVSARQILIDECAMATEPQALIPLVSNKPEKIVLIGDHKQLRPIIRNEHVRRLGMSKSLFERYFSSNTKTVMLDTQYRMDEDICKFPSDEYYEGKLKTKVVRTTSVLQVGRKQTHVVFGHIVGMEISLVVSTATGNENSKANREEIHAVVRLAKQLVTEGKINQQSIAILSPYNAQVSEIKKELISGTNENHLDQITVTTITKSQGSEWRYVILSTVRSLPSKEIEAEPDRAWRSKHVGFVGDPNQINVGITRAKEGLCIIGNQELLKCSDAWSRLFKHYKQMNFVTEAGKVSVCKLKK